MGQILKQLGQPTLGKDKKAVVLISDIVKLTDCPPFTIRCKSTIVQSDLATLIMNTIPENHTRVAELLAPFGLTCTFEK